MKRRYVLGVLSAAAIAALGGVSSASSLGSFSGNTGNDHATASFDLTGTILTVVLTDTSSTSDMQSVANSLSGLQFFFTGATLSGGTASAVTADVLANDSISTLNGGSVVGVNNGWGGSAIAGGYQVASSGLLPGLGHAFDGTALDGADYDVLPAVSAVGNTDGFPQNSPYTYGHVTLTFTVTPAAGSNGISNITGTHFYWGTAIGEGDVPGTPAVPLPAALWSGMGLLGVLGAAMAFRKKVAC